VDLRELVAVVGEEALTPRDRKFLEFADLFETRFIAQTEDEDRSIEETLGLGWDLMSTLPKEQLTRIDKKYVEKYWPGE
jgi:V/A-type H+-transporting ATPase subunit B